MRKLIYSMQVSLDGFIAGPGGEIDWSAPDEELHRFHNQQTRDVGVHLYGRRLYETMVFWETADQNLAATDVALEFARIWKAQPKLVFSRTLQSVEGNARLVTGDAAEEVARAQARAGQGPGRRRRRPGLDVHEARPDRRVPPVRLPGDPRRRYPLLHDPRRSR